MGCIQDRNDERLCAQYPDVVNVRKKKLGLGIARYTINKTTKGREEEDIELRKNNGDDDTEPTSRTFLYTDITILVFLRHIREK